MTGAFALDWASMALSLLNMVLLFWLGLTVLLNAERRGWGVWLAGAGLLLGGAFFTSHSAILGQDVRVASRGMDFWWRVGWLPVVALPFAWYAVMLWYAGFWQGGRSALRRRHRIGFALAALLVAGWIALFVAANPLPSYGQVAQLDLSATPSVGGVPVLLLLYPGYCLLCIALSLHALRRPGPPVRVMGGLARRRARPWFMAASGVLLIVSLMVTAVMVWVTLSARGRPVASLYGGMALIVGWSDLLISSLIAVATLLLGQAIVSYEVFTGKTLPRRGFSRQWRNAILLAGGYGLVVGWTLTVQLRPIYSLLLTAMLMVGFYALSSWRFFAERERYIGHLRPFLANPRLFESLWRPDSAAEPALEAEAPFRALCEHVLGAQVAYLAPLSPTAPWSGPPLAYPGPGSEGQLSSHSLSALVARLGSPGPICLPVEPSSYGGATWAVPLWSERGLTGVLLLGDKRDGGLYTQEEIEIARASGERLVDLQAAAEMGRRLVALLRRRLAEVKVMEGQGRRILHDQVLPGLHAALLYLSGVERTPAVGQAIDALASAHRQISDLMRDASSSVPAQLGKEGLIAALRTAVERDFDLDEVTWQVAPEAAGAAKGLPPFVVEVLYFAAQELVRNAARHGRGTDGGRPLRLRVSLELEDDLLLTVEDDGVGFEEGRGRESAGSNSGLQFHSTMLAAVGGSLEVRAAPTGGTRATIRLPPHFATDLGHMPDGPAGPVE